MRAVIDFAPPLIARYAHYYYYYLLMIYYLIFITMIDSADIDSAARAVTPPRARRCFSITGHAVCRPFLRQRVRFLITLLYVYAMPPSRRRHAIIIIYAITGIQLPPPFTIITIIIIIYLMN